MSSAGSTFGTFDYGLNDAAEARAQRLHAESLLVDILYEGPCGYRCFTEEMIKQLQAEWEDNPDGWTAFTSAALMPYDHALTGISTEMEDHWRSTGITGGNREIPLDFIETNLSDTLRWVGKTIAHFDRLPWTIKALEVSDFRRAKEDGKFAGWMNTQLTAGMYRLEHLNFAYDIGIRMIMLTYNKQNFLGAGCWEENNAGLSSLGTQFVQRMNELGIIVDTSHCGHQTTLDACRISSRPVVASHVGANGVYQHMRNKDDDEFRAIADTGGVIGLVTLPAFLGAGGGLTIEATLDHIDYVASLVGWEHVAIGTDHPLQEPKWTSETTSWKYHKGLGFKREDLPDFTLNLVGFDDYRDWPNLTRGLVKRGYNDDQIKGILGENFLRVFKDNCG